MSVPTPDQSPAVEPGTEADVIEHGDTDAATRPPGRYRSRRTYLVVGLALVVVAVAAVIFAANTSPSSIQPKVNINNLAVGRLAPAVDPVGWINSPPLTPASLSGKVVLYDFWTYSCINCVRTIPYLRSWYSRYQADGLVIIGIHSPEFDFEMNHANVQHAVTNLGVTWPVALDDHMVIWNQFENHEWPADYITDRTGHIRYVHLGEGDYSQTEDVLRNLLGVAAASPRATSPSAGAASAQPNTTPETYLGLKQGFEAKPGPNTYAEPGNLPADTVALSGPWTATDESIEATSDSSAIVFHFHARQVNLVMVPPASGPVTVSVELDGQPLPAAYRTSETVVSPSGQTGVTVSAPDMYYLEMSPTVEDHVLRVTANGPGLLAYDFTFGG